MEEKQNSQLHMNGRKLAVFCMSIIAVAIIVLVSIFSQTYDKKSNLSEEKAGEVYIIGDEIVYKGTL